MLSIAAVHHQFDETKVLNGIDLSVGQGEILCLLGSSGSGKSTLLRIIAGLEPLQAGEIRFDGQVLASPNAEPPAEARQFGLVFQDHVLFPHMSVSQNVAFGLNALGAAERAAVIEAQLRAVNLDAFADRYPHTLSGGQQQRVALARALAPEPRLMLLDEPFASVDSTLRRQLREDTRRALHAANVPAVVVTHDAQEAMELADVIAVIDQGEIVQLGDPEAVWRAPANRFIAELFNDADAIPGTVEPDGIATAFGTLSYEGSHAPGSACDVVVRPTAISISPSKSNSEPQITVQDIRFLGDQYVVLIEAGKHILRATSSWPPEVEIGQPVQATFDSAGVLVYLAK